MVDDGNSEGAGIFVEALARDDFDIGFNEVMKRGENIIPFIRELQHRSRRM